MKRLLQHVCSVGCVTALFAAVVAPAQAQEWGSRHVADHSGWHPWAPPVRADILVAPDDSIAVGYRHPQTYQPFLAFLQSDGTITTLEASGPTVPAIDFAIDRFGIRSFVASHNFGTDNGQGQALNITFVPKTDTSLGPRYSALALDSRGIPHIVSRPLHSSDYHITAFDIPQGQWTSSTVTPSNENFASHPPLVSAAFTSDDRLVMASSALGVHDLSIEQSDGSYYQVSTSGSAHPLSATSIATAPNGEVAWGYSDGDVVNVGIFADGVLTWETITSFTSAFLTPESFAYTPDGTLAAAFVDEEQVIYAERTGPDAWTFDILDGYVAQNATLAFDSASNPFIGLATDQDIQVISPTFSVPLESDFDGNGIVDIDDLGVLALNWQMTGRDGSSGDANGDGVVDIDDLGLLALQWQQGAGSVNSNISFAEAMKLYPTLTNIPEPMSIMLFAPGLLLLGRSRHLREKRCD